MNAPRSFPKSVLFLFGLLLVTSAFLVGYFIGGQQRARQIVPEGEGRVTGVDQVSAQLAEDVDFKMFWDVWNFVKESYYRQPVSDKDLFYGAMKGMVAGTGDSYTTYFDPEEAAEFMANLEGSFEGIGAEIGIKDDKLQIVSPLDDSPAERAGVRPGDWIVTIDGVETIGMTVEKAVTLIRGEKGTVVTLGISRNGLDTLTPIEITRDKIVINSVKWEISDQNIMEISISTFNDDTGPLFSEAIQEALTQQVDGIILDMRSNPGGLLTAAIDVSSAWSGYQPVVIERAQNKANTFKGVKQSLLSNIDTVVLVNGGSASGSEIVAGALQDYGEATVVGTTTFGKGSVQDYRQLADGSAVKVTTAEWYTPKGRSINESGIEPDINIEFTLEQFQNGHDPQKETAIEILLGTYEFEESEEEDGEIDSE